MSSLRASFGRRLTRSSLVVVPVTSLAGLAVFAVRARTSSLSPVSALMPAELNGLALLTVLALGAAWLLWGGRSPRLLSDLTVAATAAYASGCVLLVLSGTPWGLFGLYGDQRFRTEAVTRFEHALGSADYAYRGLPGHYPPLLPWWEGHLGALLGVPGWQTVKYGQILLALLVPVLAYLLWRRVVEAPQAAALVAVTTFFIGDVYKPDEWLVLALVVPWWVDAFRGHRADGARPWPAWLHGVVAGLLLSTYTFFFVPVAVATVAGLALDVARRRPVRADLARYAVIVGCGLLVSAWYWLPLVLALLRGLPSDSLQLRWLNEQLTGVPLLPAGVVAGLLVLLGAVYLVAVAARRRVAESLLLVVLGGFLTIGAGLLSAALDHPVLAWKAEPLVTQALLAGGALAPFELTSFAGRSWGGRSGVAGALSRGVLAFLVVSTLAGMLQFVGIWGQGRPVLFAHTTPLPDGSLPRAADGIAEANPQARSHPGASVMEMRKALGPDASASSVVVTTDAELYATTPIHVFTSSGSIFSNPFARFDRRVRFLQRLSATRDPQRFAALARNNAFDPIDGFVMTRNGGRYTYGLSVDNFPSQMRYLRLPFHRNQFSSSDWRVTELPGYVVVAAR